MLAHLKSGCSSVGVGKNDEVDVEGQVSSEGEDVIDGVVKGKGGGDGGGSGSGEEWPSKLRLSF